MKNRNQPLLILFAAFGTNNKLAELQQTRAAKVNAQGEMIEARKASESGKFSEEESRKFNGLNAEIRSLDAEIDEEKEVIEAEKRQADLNGKPVEKPKEKREGGEQKEKREVLARFSMKRAMEFQLDNRNFDGVESEVNEIAKEEMRSQGLEVPRRGINIPSEMMFRADSHTVSADAGGYGGNLVREELGELLPTFVDKLAIEDLGVTVKRGLVGNYPLNRGSEFAFENLAETAPTTPQKGAYDKRVMKPKRTALETGLSNLLLSQSSFNVDQDVRQRITIALNKRFILDLINGDGIDPNTLGLLNDTLGFESATAEGPLTLDKILELEGELDDQNVNGSPIFLLHKKLASVAKGINLDTGSGQFLMDKNNDLYGNKTVKTSHMPVLVGSGTTPPDLYPVIYGDFSNAYAGFWGGMNLIVDPYTKAGSNEIRMIVNVHRDIMAANPQGFVVNKKITLS